MLTETVSAVPASRGRACWLSIGFRVCRRMHLLSAPICVVTMLDELRLVRLHSRGRTVRVDRLPAGEYEPCNESDLLHVYSPQASCVRLNRSPDTHPVSSTVVAPQLIPRRLLSRPRRQREKRQRRHRVPAVHLPGGDRGAHREVNHHKSVPRAPRHTLTSRSTTTVGASGLPRVRHAMTSSRGVLRRFRPSRCPR
jgi:hypothetical protein